MGVLSNPKHELFAQLLAKGRTQIEAYREAGYRPDDGAAARLSGNVRVRERVVELQERSAIRASVSVASITENLARIAEKAERLSESAGLSVARAAHMDIAKLNGLVIDRTKADVKVSHEDALDALA